VFLTEQQPLAHEHDDALDEVLVGVEDLADLFGHAPQLVFAHRCESLLRCRLDVGCELLFEREAFGETEADGAQVPRRVVVEGGREAVDASDGFVSEVS